MHALQFYDSERKRNLDAAGGVKYLDSVLELSSSSQNEEEEAPEEEEAAEEVQAPDEVNQKPDGGDKEPVSADGKFSFLRQCLHGFVLLWLYM